MIEGSREYSAISLSAGGHDEQPWLVKSSITARGSAPAGCATRTARHESASEDANWRRTIAISLSPAPLTLLQVVVIPRKHVTRHSLRGEWRVTNVRNLKLYAAR